MRNFLFSLRSVSSPSLVCFLFYIFDLMEAPSVASFELNIKMVTMVTTTEQRQMEEKESFQVIKTFVR